MMEMIRLKTLLQITLLTSMLAACDFGDERSGSTAEIPDTVSINFRQVTVSREGRVEVLAGRVETYGTSDRSVFDQVEMKEISPEGVLTLQGGADRIEIEGSGDGTAAGGILIDDLEGDSRLRAERLSWKSNDRKLSSSGSVSIESGDGLSLVGEGFIADMAREEYTFTNGVEGTLELSDEN